MSIEITETRGGDFISVTDIDFAAVLAYLGFRQVPPTDDATTDKKKKRRKGRHLTQFVFVAEHPDRAHKVEEIWERYINDDLECSPRRLLSEARNLRNVTHHRTLRSNRP